MKTLFKPSNLKRISMLQRCLCLTRRPSMLAVRYLSSSDEAKRPSFSNFLSNEIRMEKQMWQERNESSKNIIEGFDHKFDGAMVTLSRSSSPDEEIIVKFNVSSSVDTENDNIEQNENSDDDNRPNKLYSRPEFTIDIKRKNKTLSFLCSCMTPDDNEEIQVSEDPSDNQEDFQINEFALYKSELPNEEHSKVYSADCSVIDGEFYDYLLEFLERRGIDESFAKQLVQLSTTHEHNCYLKLLGEMQEFVSDADEISDSF